VRIAKQAGNYNGSSRPYAERSLAVIQFDRDIVQMGKFINIINMAALLQIWKIKLPAMPHHARND
jgi:hypothetical protein